MISILPTANCCSEFTGFSALNRGRKGALVADLLDFPTQVTTPTVADPSRVSFGVITASVALTAWRSTRFSITPLTPGEFGVR